MKPVKPTISEIKEQFTICKDHYSGLRSAFEEDEEFYELEFGGRINIPKQFGRDVTVLPTARDVVDVAINHTDIHNARVLVNKKSTSDRSAESAEMERKLAMGLLHRTNVESLIAPGQVAAKHYWLHGLAVIKSVWDADRWIDKPPKKDGESEDAYASRIEEWRAETHFSLPIIIEAVNPSNILLDPYQNGKLYVFEWHEMKLFDAIRVWPHLRKNFEGKKGTDKVEYISYWDSHYRCDLVDGEPVLRIKGGVVNHKYGFIPYTPIESGLGNLSKENIPEQRYVGITRKIHDLLVSESTNYSLHDILMKRETLKGGYVTGDPDDAKSVENVKQAYGEYTYVPTGVEFKDWDIKVPPEASYRHMALIRDYIDGHAAPRSARGMSEAGVRSGADRRLIMTAAAAIYQYASPAFAAGWSNVLSKCARLTKNVIPGNFQIWARTPSDEFDVVVKKSILREPFNYYVEFAPISEEDEYRRQDSLVKLVQSGIYTPEFAWSQMSNVDVEKMKRMRDKEMMKSLPSYLQTLDSIMAYKASEVLQGTPIQMGAQPQLGVSPTAGAEGQRGMVPPIPNRAPLGSMGNLENMFKKQGAPTSGIQTQGRGGGGAR